jgi:hypothetical protein
MDIVITYVDGNDPVWKKDYEKYTNVPVMEKRFRDWGTLKYLLRGIEVNMPFIRNVYLVVSHTSQVPEWADTQNLKIVLHSDIIPKDYLPTFNCNPIEMHLHRIDGLDEEYLYFNDDLYPLRPCKPEDFFRGGKGVLKFSKHYFVSGMYKHICKNSDTNARKALGMPGSCRFIRPQHTCTAMLKSQCEELYDKIEPVILKSLTRTRTADNLNQYLFLDYQYFKGLMIDEKVSNKHFSVALTSPEKLKAYILNPDRNLLCVNDVRLDEERYELLRTTMLDAFEQKFPQKSRFEK